MLKRHVRNIRQLVSVAKLGRRLAPVHSRRYFRAVWRGARLCRRRRFEPVEAFRLGLFDPERGPESAACFVSRKELTRVQKALNPEACASLVKDKDIFHRLCGDSGIAVPKVYAVWRGQAGGRRSDGGGLSTCEDWERFLLEQLPAEFVVKPIRGAYGRGFNVFRRNKDGFDDAAGTRYQASDLCRALCSASMDGGILLQERLKNHPELVRLSHTEFLQTVRMITLLDSRGQAQLLHAHFKSIVGEQIVDTFLHDLTGNVEAPVESATGRLRPANQIMADGRGVRTIPTHPETGVVFEGFRLPLWDEARALAIRAAEAFWPLRTIGWDVALTPDGPQVVEGNVWWDPPNQHEHMAELLGALKVEVPAPEG